MDSMNIISNVEKSQISGYLKPISNNKAIRIHLELLSFVQNEINERRKDLKYSFSFSIQQNSDKQQNQNNKFILNKAESNNENKIENNYSDSDEEDELVNSSDMSCEEEIII